MRTGEARDLVEPLRARARWDHAAEIHAGEIPHSLSIEAPGSRTIGLAAPERVRRTGHRLDREAAPLDVGRESPVNTMRYG